jgi:hypothetical protein
LNPQDAEAYYNRVIAHVISENTKQAIEDYNKVIDLTPQLANGKRIL